MSSQRDFVVHGKYAYQHQRIDPRIRHNDFEYPRVQDFHRGHRGSYNRYQFTPAEFYNSIQREGRAYDLAARYRRHDAMVGSNVSDARSASEYQQRKQIWRSDDAISDTIYVRLTDHPDLDATDIVVEVKDAEVTLTGLVDSRRSKRLAEDVCDRVRGVQHVENRLRVQPPLGNGMSVVG